MNSYRKTAIIVGVLFLTSSVAIMLGAVLIDPIMDAPDDLINVYPNRTQVILGVLLELYCGVAVLGIGVLMFPILKKHNESIAVGYVGIRAVECAIFLFPVISGLLLITISQEFVKAGAQDASSFQTLGTFLLATRDWSFVMIRIFTGLAGLIFSYSLYQSKLVPRLISILGLIGYALLVAGTLLEMFGVIDTLSGAGMIIFIPGGLFELLVLPIWLFVKGFNPSAIASGSAKTGINEIN